MEMLSGGGLFAPRARDDGTFAFASPVGEGYVSMIALDDLAFYVDWIFENPTKSVGIDLKVSTEDVYWDDLVKTSHRGESCQPQALSRAVFCISPPAYNRLLTGSLTSILTLKSLRMTLKLSPGFKILVAFGRFGETSWLNEIINSWIRFIRNVLL